MTTDLVAFGTAAWLGLLTAISPCPLASNIAAVSYVGRSVGRPRDAVLAGFTYALGRTVTYVLIAVLAVSSALSIPRLSLFLQHRMNQALGPLLILIGACLLGWIRLPAPSFHRHRKVAAREERISVLGAGLLGVLFALSFCPVSAGLFFGALIPLAVGHESRLIIPFVYGVATGLPVALFALLLATGAHGVGRAFHAVSAFERVARRGTGVVFLLAGLYLIANHVLGLSIW